MSEQTLEVLQRALTRERKRRAVAESLLEEKSRKLYVSYRKLEAAHTELQESKNLLVQSEKMASLGVMSAGIAHEINNPIGFVQSNLNTLREYAPIFAEVVSQTKALLALTDDDVSRAAARDAVGRLFDEEDIDFVVRDANDILDESASGIERVREIVAGLKTFSRMDDETHAKVDVNACLINTLNIARRQFKHQCRIIDQLDELPAILGSAGGLQQVFMNLIVNAGQALPDEGGVITVRSRKVDECVVISVEDTGCGVSAEDQAKLFQPFFTTKAVGRGTGLGLSISLGIVADHNGELSCESQLGHGARFTVRLPVRLPEVD